MPESAYRVTRTGTHGGGAALQLEGRLTFAGAGTMWSELAESVEAVGRGERLDFDMSGVEQVDGGSMALLVQLRAGLHRRGATSEFIGADEQAQKIIHLYRGDALVGRLKRRRPQKLLAQIGENTLAVLTEFKQVFGFFGQALVASVGVIARPRTLNWKDVLPTMERAGADAVPIVVLINFLVGFVMAFQGAVQLKQFGANIYVADLVGLSICREMGPLMTAIILCGRSGAAFAAELGSMKVNEEIDALRTMGFGPMRFLVLPRTIALVLVLPLLTLLGDAMGLLGGLTVGLLSLDLTLVGYLNETQKALSMWDIFSGTMKSVVFAMVISLIACQQGVATTGGAQGVGKRTTSAVVSILFALILVDAAFTIAFSALGL
ncbi:MAG: MlaE family lipid ABC transporter permease subunit [Myxococcaceae bacterium]